MRDYTVHNLSLFPFCGFLFQKRVLPSSVLQYHSPTELLLLRRWECCFTKSQLSLKPIGENIKKYIFFAFAGGIRHTNCRWEWDLENSPAQGSRVWPSQRSALFEFPFSFIWANMQFAFPVVSPTSALCKLLRLAWLSMFTCNTFCNSSSASGHTTLDLLKYPADLSIV